MSVGYTGLLAGFPAMARALTKHPLLTALRLRAVLARLRLLDRIVLTPEGITFEEQRRLTRAMLRRGYRVFSLTFHSPSLAPGNTPYVRDSAQLQSFLRRIEQYLEFFMTEVGGHAVTPFEIKERALRLSATAQSCQDGGAGAMSRREPGRGPVTPELLRSRACRSRTLPLTSPYPEDPDSSFVAGTGQPTRRASIARDLTSGRTRPPSLRWQAPRPAMRGARPRSEGPVHKRVTTCVIAVYDCNTDG